MAVHSNILLVLIFIGGSYLSKAQELSQQPIAIQLKNVTLKQALEKINALEDVKLAYNPDQIPSDKMVDQSFEEEPLAKVLEVLLGSDFHLKFRGSYVIIQPKKKTEKKKHPIKLSVQ
ncbi:hypothetical protein [Reichenbachiella sp.]|uniref:hypothetical protein n=1 Tax=Reichenbachiella sp. TaxID=2184521 RepID=UPI003BAF6443